VLYPGILFEGGGSTNSVEDIGQRERGSGGSIHLVRGYAQFAIQFDFVKLSGCTDVFPTELGTQLSFVKTSEFRGVGGLNLPNSPPRYATGYDNMQFEMSVSLNYQMPSDIL
jgi:hypothetical protein